VLNLQNSDYIKTFDDFASIALLKAIDKLIYEKEDFYQAGIVGENGEGKIQKEIRSVGSFPFEENQIGASVARRVLFNDLTRLTNKFYSSYVDSLSVGKESKAIFDYQFLKYTSEDQGHYNWHTDDSRYTPRMYTIIVGLNDEYLGGEFKILNEDTTFKIRKNQAIMFPSNLCFPHKVEQVTEGTRKVLVIWIR